MPAGRCWMNVFCGLLYAVVTGEVAHGGEVRPFLQ